MPENLSPDSIALYNRLQFLEQQRQYWIEYWRNNINIRPLNPITTAINCKNER